MTTLYEKVGKRYKPVREERYWDSWPQGFHLVYSNPHGGKSYRFGINPDHAALEAAIRQREDAIRDVILNAMEMRPAKRPITEKQRKAWVNFKTEMGGEGFVVEYNSINAIIDEIVKVLLDEPKNAP